MPINISARDREIIHKLAAEVAALSALPVQEEKRGMWRRLNGLKPVRPMVMIDQVCWNEMNVDDELTLECVDDEARGYEWHLKSTLYQWKHFPVDMVIDPFIRVHRAVGGAGFGVGTKERTAVLDPQNSVVGHAYINQFETDADLEKIKMPVVTHDEAETRRRVGVARELFKGTLDVVEQGPGHGISVWDPITGWMSVEEVCIALAERPDFLRAMARKMVKGYLSMLDQFEALNLLGPAQSTVHCTGAWTDELPAPMASKAGLTPASLASGFDPKKYRTKDLWMYGLAQMFSTVSPKMFDEFEIEMCMPIFNRFGLVYYGCCDPLDGKLKEVKKIPNVRKISMSPWVDEEIGASGIKGDYVYSRKPNPALLAWPQFREDAVREHLKNTVDTCARHGCPLELILKDISTVNYEPRRLWRWAEIAMEVVQ